MATVAHILVIVLVVCAIVALDRPIVSYIGPPLLRLASAAGWWWVLRMRRRPGWVEGWIDRMLLSALRMGPFLLYVLVGVGFAAIVGVAAFFLACSSSGTPARPEYVKAQFFAM